MLPSGGREFEPRQDHCLDNAMKINGAPESQAPDMYRIMHLCRRQF